MNKKYQEVDQNQYFVDPYLTPADIPAQNRGPHGDNEHKEVKMIEINEHINFNKALLCSGAFLGLYTAFYSA